MARYRPEPEPQTTGMLNRSPSSECPLCRVWGIPWDPNNKETWNKQHVHAEALWKQWNPEKKGWPQDVVAALDNLGLGFGCTEKQASDHYRHHRPEQPMSTSYADRERSLDEALNLAPELREVILTIYRQRFLSTKQVQELFFTAGRSEKSAKQKTSVELTKLARMNMLYRYYPSIELGKRRGAPKHFSRQALWFLGRRAAPFIEESTGLKVWQNHYVQMAKQVDENLILHDLRLADLYVTLHQRLREQENMLALPDGRMAPANLNINNWYSVRHLSFGFFDRLTQQSKEVASDAFATISLQRPSFTSGDLPACQLPFFLEYDRGSKVFADVAGQILNYHLMAIARSAGKRFTDLSPDDYSVPMIMVFSDEGRIEGIKGVFQDLATQLGIMDGSPIFLADEESWLNDPFASNLLSSAWDQENRRFSLVDLLLRSSAPLMRQKIILPSQRLTINMKGARRTDGGGARRATLAEGRQKLQQKRKARSQESDDSLESVLNKASEQRREQIKRRRDKSQGRPVTVPRGSDIEKALQESKKEREKALEKIKQPQPPPKVDQPAQSVQRQPQSEAPTRASAKPQVVQRKPEGNVGSPVNKAVAAPSPEQPDPSTQNHASGAVPGNNQPSKTPTINEADLRKRRRAARRRRKQ